MVEQEQPDLKGPTKSNGWPFIKEMAVSTHGPDLVEIAESHSPITHQALLTSGTDSARDSEQFDG